MPSSLHEQPFSLAAPQGGVIDGDVRFRESEDLEIDAPRPVVVMCHGFKGFKDWGPFPAWGRRLAEAGFASVLFNFSYNGVAAEQPTAFTELSKFADNTFTRELDDLAAVLDAVASGDLPGAPMDANRIGLMGHSRGGGTAILQAARDERIRALVTWSSVFGFIERFTPEQIDEWTRQGYTEVMNSRTGQRMRLNRVLYDDAMAHKDELDVLGAAGRIGVPWLIVHAPDDAVVPLREAHALDDASDQARLVEVEGGHTFGGAHPYEGEVPDALRRAWDETQAFFEEALREEATRA